MTRSSSSIATLLVLAVACTRSGEPNHRSGEPPAAQPGATPALVVVLVVDQLGEPLLERYDVLFTGGFRRLLDQGRVYVNAAHDHAETVTAPGHATLFTGVHPSRHGIVANDWHEKAGDRWLDVASVEDQSRRIVGESQATGVSPHRLERSGLADWIRAAEPRSRVASVSAKARSAVLPAGHVRGEVYWFDTGTGRFVTSTFYRERYPDWAERFNETVLSAYRSDTVWASTVPAGARARSSADTAAYEGDGMHTSFPHRFALEGRPAAFWDWFEHTPMLDGATLDFAETMVSALELGGDSLPDLLNVGLSQTDRVGHAYGPLSREQLDNLLRLDRRLARFFEFLDSTVGPGRWVVALSADHGVAPTPEDLPGTETVKARRATRAEKAALDSIRADADRRRADPATPGRVVAALERLDFVADAWTHEELEKGPPADSFAALASRSAYPGRVTGEFGRIGVGVRFVEGFIDLARGTEHGSPYWYDRHVPMIFMGPGIPAGRDSARAAMVNLAPTLARFLGLPFPTDLDGSPLKGVIGS